MKLKLIIGLTLLLFGCGDKNTEFKQVTTVESPTDFFFVANFNAHDRYFSKDSTLSRSYDLGDSIIKTGLTLEEKTKVYNAMLANNFFDLPKEIAIDRTKSLNVPSQVDGIVVFIGGKIKNRVRYWRGGTPVDTTESRRFDNVLNLIQGILTKNPVYKKLAPSNIPLQNTDT
jgi:hypothetical protein